MSLLARDPERDGKGAVRAIIEELLRKAKEEGVCVWCVAGNEKARGVYDFFGFKECGVVELWDEVRGNGGKVRAWCMVWSPQEKK
jgi:predicted acetyltransferase